MKIIAHIIAPLAITLALAATPATAACYADYKAKQDGPLRLHYGVAQISDAACGDNQRAAAELTPRLAQAGWTLLTIMSTFGETALQEKRAGAGDYFLRY